MAFNNRILAIDDDNAILEVFRTVFTATEKSSQESSLMALSELLEPTATTTPAARQTFQLDTASQGEAGFNLVRQGLEDKKPYATVFIDMRMPPGWDGIQTARKIREIDPFVQIIIVTAYSDASVPEIVRQVGFTERFLYLKKPFDDEEILQMADSLTMRWNLEKKTCNFIKLLHAIFHSFIQLDFLAQSQDMKPFLQEILSQLSDFLDTPNIFLTHLIDNEINFRLGSGRFQAEQVDETEFQAILAKALAQEKTNTVVRFDDFVVIPITCQDTQAIIIGIVPEHEMRGINKLLSMLACYTSKLCTTGNAMQALQLRNQELEQLLKQREAQ